MEEQQPVTALPPVLVEVDKHGTRMTGEYAAVWVFLTYAALFWDELNSHEDVVEQLKIKVAARDGRTIECWVICREKHANPASPDQDDHIHFLYKSSTRMTIRDRNWWDLEGRVGTDGLPRRLHPYIVTPNNGHRDLPRLCNYIVKGGKCAMDLGTSSFTSFTEGAEQNWAKAALACETKELAAKLIRENYETIWLTKGPTVLQMLALSFPTFENSRYALTDFTQNYDLFALATSNKCLVLTGMSGAGKTELALALHPSNANLLVRSLDDLKNFRQGYHTKIVFDDFSMKDMKMHVCLHMLDIAHTATIKCRYTNATIPAGIPRVFTTNLPLASIVPVPQRQSETDALHRRVKVVQITANLFQNNE